VVTVGSSAGHVSNCTAQQQAEHKQGHIRALVVLVAVAMCAVRLSTPLSLYAIGDPHLTEHPSVPPPPTWHSIQQVSPPVGDAPV
jgi:hypothetical protein